MNKLILILLLVISGAGLTQTVRVEGRIAIEDTNEILGSLSIFSLPDSSLTKGSYVDSSYFSVIMSANGTKDFYVKFKVFGFSDTTLNFTVADSIISLGEIPLEPKTLDEVEVSYIRPAYVRTMDGIKVNVEGTNLETLTNLFEVLKASPKISSPDDQTIEIIGKGVPLILIDRQPIISIEELKAIPADQIQHIEIMTNPSAKYQAQSKGGGVIEVYTKNFHLEGYNMTINTGGATNTQLKPSGNLGLGLSFKRKKFSFNGNLGGYVDTRYSSSMTNGIATDGSDREYQSSSESHNWWTWHNVNLKASYRINDRHRLTTGVRSSGSFSGNETTTSTSYIESGLITSDQSQTSNPSYTWLNNSAFLNYLWVTDTNKSSFEININYLLKVSEGKNAFESLFDDVAGGSFSVFTRKNDARDRPNIGEIKATYEHVFDTTGWKWNIGGAYSSLINGKAFNQFNLIDEQWVIDPLYTNSYDYREQIGGLFTEVIKMWKVFGFRAGVRGEYTSLSGYSNSLDQQFIDSSYILPFPSASIMLNPNKKLAFTLYYQSGINRPSFFNFDPFVRIMDSLNITYGNPYLKPEIKQSIGLEVDLFNMYNLSVEYRFDRDRVSIISFFDDSSFLVSTTPWNASSERSLSFSLGAPIQTTWLKGWNSLWVKYSNYEFGPEFGRNPFYALNYGLVSNLTFILPKNLNISNRVQLSRYSSDDYVVQASASWGMRLTKKFNGNKFQFFIDVDDIIPSNVKATTYSGNYELYSEGQYNFTSFKLGLFYKFGRLKQAPNIKESNSSQSGRI